MSKGYPVRELSVLDVLAWVGSILGVAVVCPRPLGAHLSRLERVLVCCVYVSLLKSNLYVFY